MTSGRWMRASPTASSRAARRHVLAAARRRRRAAAGGPWHIGRPQLHHRPTPERNRRSPRARGPDASHPDAIFVLRLADARGRDRARCDRFVGRRTGHGQRSVRGAHPSRPRCCRGGAGRDRCVARRLPSPRSTRVTARPDDRSAHRVGRWAPLEPRGRSPSRLRRRPVRNVGTTSCALTRLARSFAWIDGSLPRADRSGSGSRGAVEVRGGCNTAGGAGWVTRKTVCGVSICFAANRPSCAQNSESREERSLPQWFSRARGTTRRRPSTSSRQRRRRAFCPVRTRTY